MAYLGSFAINDYLGIPADCHKFTTGAAFAPTVLTYTIYEDSTDVGLIAENVDMVVASPFDAIVGHYWIRLQLTAASGFELGKNYHVVIKATVDGVAAITTHTFQMLAKVDARAIDGTAQSATDLKDFADTGYDPATHKVAGVVLTDTCTTTTTTTTATTLTNPVTLANGAHGGAGATITLSTPIVSSLGNVAHGGAAATLTLLSGVINNSGGVGLSITGSTTGVGIHGATIGLDLDASNGPAADIDGTTYGLDINASAGDGIQSVGSGYDVDADIHGMIDTVTTATTATNLTNNTPTAGTITTVTNQLTAAAIATGVWQDATANDFTTASSIGKALFISNIVPGASGGHMISGSNAGTTTLGALTVTGATTLTGTVVCSDAVTVAKGVAITGTGVGGAGLAITGAGSGAGMNITGGATGPGLLCTGGGNNADADGIRAVAGGALAKGVETDRLEVTGTTTLTGVISAPGANVISGTLATVTNLTNNTPTAGTITTVGTTTNLTNNTPTAGTITTVGTTTNLTNAPANGDLTAAMILSVNAACDTACSDQLIAVNLDHLMKTAVINNADMTAEVADGTVLSNMISTGDTSTFDRSIDGLRPMATVVHDIHATDLPAVKGDTFAVKVVTDQFRFAVENEVNANTRYHSGTIQTAGDIAPLITTVDGVVDAIKVVTDKLATAIKVKP
jgi:hypothetical protein